MIYALIVVLIVSANAFNPARLATRMPTRTLAMATTMAPTEAILATVSIIFIIKLIFIFNIYNYNSFLILRLLEMLVVLLLILSQHVTLVTWVFH